MKRKFACLAMVGLLVTMMVPSSVFAQSKDKNEAPKPMYRLYNPNSGEHFYTGSALERASVIKAGWNDEGIGWIAPEKSDTPVYRLYNANAGDHHYTINKAERDYLVKVGWMDEGIGWYSASEEMDRQQLYREYNPNAKSGTHNYTASKGEHQSLIKAGWRDEGFAWFGLNFKREVVKPNPAAITEKSVLNQTVRADFSANDVIAVGDGSYTMIKFEVWDCEHFDKNKIQSLKMGDQIIIDGETVDVASVKMYDNWILINGGVDNGGYDFTWADDDTYRNFGYDGTYDRLDPLFNITLPVASDATFEIWNYTTMQSETMDVRTFAEKMVANEDMEFGPDATKITVENGEITAVVSDFTP